MSNVSSSHAERYRGKNLLRLLAAICVPAGLLYLRLVLTFAGAENVITARQATWLLRAATVSLIAFFLTQLVAAWYLWTLLPIRTNKWRSLLEFLAVWMLALLFSATGAVMLEAFGYSLFTRVHGGS